MSTTEWRVVAATSIGTSHLIIGSPCQDSAGYSLVPIDSESILVAVVCDGAGSAAYSDVGSAIVVDIIMKAVSRYVTEGGRIAALERMHALQWVEQANQALGCIAGKQNHQLSDYACTLLLAIIGSNDAAFLQIGDGAIVVSHGDADGWSYVFWPQHGEYANTTNFVTSSDVSDVMEFETAVQRIDEIALFSDGLENLVLHHASKTVHEHFFQSMIRPVRGASPSDLQMLSTSLSDYLSSPTICDRTDDDKSLVLASRLLSEIIHERQSN